MELKYNERGKSRIEVSDILNYFKDINSYYNDCTRYDTLKRMLEDIVSETKEDAERKVGKWIGTEYDGYADGYPVYYEWKCSACGCVIEDDEPTWNFCPNCGAKMEEGEQDG